VLQAGIEKLTALRVLWMSNNKLKDWAELDRLAANSHLEEVLLLGNPLLPPPGSPEYRIEVHWLTEGAENSDVVAQRKTNYGTLMSLILTFTKLPGEHVCGLTDFTHALCSLK